MTAAPVPQSYSNTIIGSGTSIAVPVPSGVSAGDIVIVCLYVETTGTVTPPAGFTQKSSASTTASGQAHTARIFWKRATGSDSGTYTFSWSGTVYHASASMRVSGGTASGDPFGSAINTAVNNSGTGTTTPAPSSLTPSTDYCLLVFFGTSYYGGPWTPPSTWTERVDNSYPPTLATKSQTTATATGSVSATTAASAVGRTGSVGYLLPAAATYSVSGTSAVVSGSSGNVTVISIPQLSGASEVVSGASGNITIAHYGVSGTAAIVSGTSGAITSILQVSGTSEVVSDAIGSVRVTGKPGQGSEVLALFDPDEVLIGGRVTYYRFDLLDADEHLIGHLVGVISGTVSVDAYSAVKATGQLTVVTDPTYSHLPDGQPDFLGVQLNTPLGPQATSTTAVTYPVDHFSCSDADAVEISQGDSVALFDSGEQPKSQQAFTVTAKESSLGTTTLYFSPSSSVAVDIGDILKVVEVSYEQLVDWLNVRIRPMISISRLGGGDDPDGRQVPTGVFLCAAPVENWGDQGLSRQVELADKLSVLDQDIASGDPDGIAAYSVDVGANVIDTVKTLIEETGEVTPAIEPDATVLAAAMVWQVGTTRLRVINDLLDAAGYFSLFCDGWGRYQAVPYVQPSDRVPVYESIAPFSDGPQSLMDPSWIRDRDIYSIPNRYLVIGQGDGDNAALTSVATNEDPGSPYSYSSRGRWITQVEEGVEAADQATLDTIARARLSRATSVTNQLTVKHAFLPDLKINSVIRFVNPDSGLDIYCYVVNTSIEYDPTALCTTVMRLVS